MYYYCSLCSCGGLNVSALKILVDAIDPMLLTSFRIMTAGVAVLIACWFMGILRWPMKHEWLVIFGLSIFNVILHHIFIAVGFDMTTGVNASLILGLTPLVTMMMAVLLLRQRVSKVRVLGFFIGFAGVVVANVAGSGGFGGVSLGDFFVFLGILVQGFSFVMISKLKPTFDPRLATGYMMVFGSVFIL
ncbi:DMT family transporter [Piscibacillus salipiscarius]|uniref:DMT family transporter n=1 Tax=Piscibacillus salipiscarius TaxID=299480 RepID=UPI0024362F83|nr:DMT family transporter [Piscibacillus salipiscarius]